MAKRSIMKKTYLQRRTRTRACRRQAGHCIYCECLMWQGSNIDAFCAQHDLDPEHAQQLRCTAEHLLARCDGGSNAASNIAAACLYCNLKRHACRKAKASHNYARYVRAQMRKNQWHLFDPCLHGLLPAKETPRPAAT